MSEAVLPAPGPADVQPVAHETRDRIATGLVTAVPLLALGVVAWQSWQGLLKPVDLIIFAVFYVLTGLGVTVGFHRLFTHRSFKAKPAVRGTLAILGSIAIEGPVISWVADHRKHHAFSDKVGDPHSPHVEHGGGLRGELRGFVHAHIGWLFVHDQRGSRTRYAPDLLRDPVVSFVDRTFVLWALGGLLLPFLLGFAIGGSLAAGLTALLWGGLVRLFVLHHLTYSINSVCHVFGRRPFTANDRSTNNWLLALPSLGEAWHHNHHVFPTSAFHGLGWRQVDLSGIVIAAWEKVGLVRNVRRPSAEQIGRKRTAAAGA